MRLKFRSLHPLAENGIHIWKVEIGNLPAHFQSFLGILAEDELKRQERFLIAEKKFQYVATRGVLRTLLGLYTQSPPEALEFTYDEHGKPSLTHPIDLQFNISHSSNLALMAFTRNQEVGIDLERMRPIEHMQAIADRVFTADENIFLRSLKDSEAQLDFFFRCWARKEALMKALGTGFAYALSCSLKVFDAQGKAKSSCNENGKKWSLHELQPDPAFRAALAVSQSKMKIKNYSFNVLLERSSLW